MTLNDYAQKCHEANIKWWANVLLPCKQCKGSGQMHYPPPAQEAETCDKCDGVGYEPKDRNTGELLMLCVSELAEAMEGHRKSLPDDKLPHRSMFEVELADCLIRIFDLAGARGLDLQGAYEEKMAYNAQRADHKIEQRLQPGGKAY